MEMTNLIGISGRAGSGKDTVGQIIQYLTDESVNKFYTFEQWAVESHNGHDVTKWKVKRFADKPKECASIILGIPREKFEDSAVKSGLISEAWGDLTVRKFLQLFGTQVGRAINEKIWINALFADYKKTTLKWDADGNSTVDNYPNWICTDVRFENECDAIVARGGVIIRMRRNEEVPSDHTSETDLDEYPHFDYVIDNRNISIDQLITIVRDILIIEKIISK